jgi:hypothetical protein
MDRKYIVVRANSTTGPYVAERNASAPNVNAWTKADVAGYASTLRDAERMARTANREAKQ